MVVGISNSQHSQSGALYDRKTTVDDSPPRSLEREQRLWDWCRDRDIDLGTLNLQYCTREKRIASTVIGFSNPDRVDQNVEALFTPIEDDIWTELRRDFELA